MKPYIFGIIMVLLLLACRQKEEVDTTSFSGKPEVPSIILKDHQYFLKKLEQAISFEDSTGMAAKKLYEVMEYHFRQEEEYVLPALGILPGLARGQIPEETEKIFLLTERFRKNENVMLAEHQMISHYAAEIVSAAERDGHTDLVDFEVELKDHATLEEEILFPAVLVVGKYLEQQRNKDSGK